MPATLFYAHDPMCSWCWAFRPAHDVLVKALAKEVTVTRLLGGLAPDSDQPMKAIMRQYIQEQWQKVQQQVPATEFNLAFWEQCQPRRSTYPACRAVIAARKQGKKYDDMMTRAIQQAYYLQARNPSDQATLLALADEIGLDHERFANDLQSAATEKRLQKEIQQCRDLGLLGFPGLLLEHGNQHIPIEIDYNQPETMIRKIRHCLAE